MDASPRQSCHTKIRYDNYPSIFWDTQSKKTECELLQKPMEIHHTGVKINDFSVRNEIILIIILM